MPLPAKPEKLCSLRRNVARQSLDYCEIPGETCCRVEAILNPEARGNRAIAESAEPKYDS